MVSRWDGVECCDFLFLQGGEADTRLCSAVLLGAIGKGLRAYEINIIHVDSHTFQKIGKTFGCNPIRF